LSHTDERHGLLACLHSLREQSISIVNHGSKQTLRRRYADVFPASANFNCRDRRRYPSEFVLQLETRPYLMQQPNDPARQQAGHKCIIRSQRLDITRSRRKAGPPDARNITTRSPKRLCGGQDPRCNRSWSRLKHNNMMAAFKNAPHRRLIEWLRRTDPKHGHAPCHAQLIKHVAHGHKRRTDCDESVLLALTRAWQMLDAIQFQHTDDAQRIGRLTRSRKTPTAQPGIVIHPCNTAVWQSMQCCS
jgi:hypothetical protein